MMLSLNLRRIRYYTPYNRQVLPKHRNMVRMNPKLTVEEDLPWKEPYQPGELRLPESAHKGRNHKMKDNQGCQLRG
jgi:hypothetical protein